MNVKTKIIILIVICLVVLGIALGINNYLINKNKDYLKEISYDELIEKVENKDTFILLISQTTCSHCMEYKPKLNNVASKYKIEVYYIEVDLLPIEQTKNLKKHFSFSGTPQTIFVIDGSEETAATRINGNASTEKIISKFKSNGFID